MTKPKPAARPARAAVARPRPLKRQPGLALWRQIEARLEQLIATGTYAEGRLPAEHELAEHFEVNRHTVRQALLALKERGVLRTQQGRGSFVRQSTIEYTLGLRTRFSQNLAKHNVSGRLRVLGSEVIAASAEVAKALGLRVGVAVEQVETVGLADNVPISVSTHSFPHAALGGIGELLRKNGSITRALAKLGVEDYLRASTRITAELPDALTVERLEIGATQPVLRVCSVNVDADGRPIQYSETAFCADRVQLVVDNEALTKAN
jgi:GntR family transcriptional regulator, phosphonate transport system regulatory protein